MVNISNYTFVYNNRQQTSFDVFFDNYLHISEFELTCTLDSKNPLPNINGYLEYFVVKCRNFECKYISVMH